MIDWLKKLFLNNGDGRGVIEHPIIHQFPDVGLNGEVTIDCIVRTSARAYNQNTSTDQESNSGMPKIDPHCVGVVFVEVDEYGLRFRWQPRECADDVFLSPFGRPPFKPPRTHPTTESAK